MAQSDKPTPLEIHTLDTLCDELVSGRAVVVDDNGKEFVLTSLQTRSIFDWYRQNRKKWGKNVQTPDVEALVDQLAKSPPTLPAVAGVSAKTGKRILRLKSIRVHRFAGIHRYGSANEAPEEFEFEFDQATTLIEGDNAAGKTSLLNAIIWCLTGRIHRSQRPPEVGDEPIRVASVDGSEQDGDSSVFDEITPITPLPPIDVLKATGGKPLPLDTWVELAFEDDQGNKVGPIRRSLRRTSRGKVKVDEPDLSQLGISPIALEVGTTMPGLLPYLRLGEPSDLGQAVATLTGIRPLQDLVKHAKKAKEKLRKDLVKDREREIEEFDEDYRNEGNEYRRMLADHPELKPKQTVPEPSTDSTIEDTLESCRKHFEGRQAEAFQQAQQILGDSFDSSDAEMRKDLTDNVGPAIGLLGSDNLGRLPSANRLRRLGSLNNNEISSALNLVKKLQAQAQELADMAAAPDVAQRMRLYARVAGWLKDLPEVPSDVKQCPVCDIALEGKLDPVTQEPVTKHLQHHLLTETDHLEKTLDQWARASQASLLEQLPEALATELKNNADLPASPTDLITMALTDELFESPVLKNSLVPLKSAIVALCTEKLSSIPTFSESGKPILPACFGDGGGDLGKALGLVTRAIAFAQWRKANQQACAEAFKAIVGETGSAEQARLKSGVVITSWSLRRRLAVLDDMVKQATPLKEALSRISTMKTKLENRRKKEDRIQLYSQAAKAIEPLFELDQLVQRQVTALMDGLSSETKKWKNRLYLPSFESAPAIKGADVAADGSLLMEAEVGGTKAGAHHVSNASDLRATLLAFLISFWQHLIEKRGGLSLLIFDDLHELFDPPNRRRVANALPELVTKGATVVLTTNDPTFRREVALAFSQANLPDSLEQRHLHPLNAVRSRVELGLFMEEVQAKRRDFERPENHNEAQPAIDYARAVRVYSEDRLLDFFRGILASTLSSKPTCADLVNEIRSLRNSGQEPFTDQVFGNLVDNPALASGSTFLLLMNDSHHGSAKITYTEVAQEAAACERVCRLINWAHEAYERWLRRDPPIIYPAKPPGIPEPLVLNDYQVPLIEQLAAFTSDTGPSEALESDETFSTSSLTNQAAFFVKTHSLGFSAPSGYRVLVSLSDEQPPDNSLVIAIHGDRVYAGRLHRDVNSPAMVVIGSEAENPMLRPPSVFLPTAQVRLLQVSGVLFDDTPCYEKSSNDVVLLKSCDLLDQVKIAFKVEHDSALPLAIEGQTILGGECIVPDQLGAIVGLPVAVATTDGAALKRVGQVLPGATHVRMFNSLGGLGDSMLVRVEALDDDPFEHLPLLNSARKVLGVLYQ